MNIPVDLLTPEQERELDKVNVFYLQKEAEVCKQNEVSGLNHQTPQPCLLNNVVANRHIAQNSTQDLA